METLHYSICDSPVGPLAIVMSGAGLLRLQFHRKESVPFADDSRTHWIEDPNRTAGVRKELDEYLPAVGNSLMLRWICAALSSN